MLPGSTEAVLLPILEKYSGKRVDVDFGLAYNPEFLREGTSISDFYHPPRTVIGQTDDRGGDLLARLYVDVEAPVVRSSIRVAEMVKYVDNTFHALKVTFANEIGSICKAEGIDSHEVMDIFCLDTKLNLSPAYLKPGYAYGGSCLPKDLRALIHRARSRDVVAPLLEAIPVSNEQPQRLALDLIARTGKKRVGLLGLSFKAGTDDLRESPSVSLVERLIGKGYAVRIHDRNVSLATIFGSNRAYVEREIPHLASLMRERLADVTEWADTLVIASRDPEYDEVIRYLREDQVAIDLVRLPNQSTSGGRYHGIAW
jgi:GDP-mannose 6-dehydrogenase